MKFIGALNLVELSEVVQLGDNKSSQHLFSVFGNWTENQCWVGTQSQLVKSELELGLIIGTRFGTGTVFSVFKELEPNWKWDPRF